MTKLTIKEEMRAIDTKDRGWYDSLTAEERKKLGIWVLMRYASSCKHDIKEIEEHYLEMTNELVNVHHNVLRHHPQLQFQLMQALGLGKSMFHPWLQPGKRGTESKLHKVFSDAYPQLNQDELDIFIAQHTKDDLIDLMEQLGYEKKDIKKILK